MSIQSLLQQIIEAETGIAPAATTLVPGSSETGATDNQVNPDEHDDVNLEVPTAPFETSPGGAEEQHEIYNPEGAGGDIEDTELTNQKAPVVEERQSRSEFVANDRLSQQKNAPGHYIKQNGNVLSGPHSSENDAIAAFKNLTADQQVGSKLIKESEDGTTAEISISEEKTFAEKFSASLNEGTTFTVKIGDGLNSLIESQGFDSEFGPQAKELFEAAVNDVARDHTTKLNAYASYVFEELMTERMSQLDEEVGTKLDEAIAAWTEANQIGISDGIRTQVAESFMTNLKNVLSEHYVEVPAQKADLYESSLEVVSESATKLKEAESDIVAITKELSGVKKQLCVEQFIRESNLSALSGEKIRSLSESLEFSDAESFAKKLGILQESYVKATPKKAVVDSITEDAGMLMETTPEEKNVAPQHPDVTRLAQTISGMRL